MTDNSARRMFLLTAAAALAVAVATSPVLAQGTQPATGAPPSPTDLPSSLAPPRTTPDNVPTDGPDIPQPPQLRAQNGILNVTLVAAPALVTVAGKRFTSNVFNGQYIPPTLVLKRGDRLNLTLVNNIGPSDNVITAPQPTNTHYHGLNISPQEPGDNVYLIVPSSVPIPPGHDHSAADETAMAPTKSRYRQGNRYSYSWQVPVDHSQGQHWYHPHVHGHVEDQLLSGMSGLILIDGLLEEHYPEFAQLERRQLIFKDIVLPGADDKAPKTKTINGVLGGVIRTSPGDLEVWELGNLGADSFVDFAIDGHKFWVLSRDGNALDRPKQVESVFLPPASRAMVVVEGGNAGTYGMRTLEIDNGPAGDPNPQVVLGAFVVSGPVSANYSLRPRLLQPATDLKNLEMMAAGVRAMPITRRRQIRYTESNDGNTFYINGREFDTKRNDVEVTLGDVEEWTIVNDTDERHTFHIHQTDFLVTDINGDDQDATGLRDVIDVPYRQDGKPGRVTIIIPFRNPLMVGRFPFHCHIVEHEDGGMMANVLVKPK